MLRHCARCAFDIPVYEHEDHEDCQRALLDQEEQLKDAERVRKRSI